MFKSQDIDVIISKLNSLLIKKNAEIVKLKLKNKRLELGEYSSLERKLNNHSTITKYIRYNDLSNKLMFMDVRDLFQSNGKIVTFTGTDQEIIKQALDWVKRIKIVTKSDYNLENVISYPGETIVRGYGSANDIQILLANILVNSGIPYYRIRINVSNDMFFTRHYTDRWTTLIPIDISRLSKNVLDYSFNKRYVF